MHVLFTHDRQGDSRSLSTPITKGKGTY